MLLNIFKNYGEKKKAETESSRYSKLMNKFEKSVNRLTFPIELLNEMTFGGYEGEQDENLEDLFCETKVIKKIIKGNYNYILAPKGCGKSALFKAYEKRFINNQLIQKSNKTIIISINDTFAYEKIAENNDFMNKNIEKQWAMIWGVFILKKIFKVISSDSYKSIFKYFIHKSTKYDDIKKEFEVFNLWDYIEQINIGVKFNIRGQEISATPSIKKNKPKKNISLNDFYNESQAFLREKNLKIYVLIDRVDDFVVGEDKEQKKSFIQGLYYCVEELCNEANIVPLFFLRTDLFYNLNMETGIDKIQIRTIELKWEKDELINFIFRRLMKNNPKFSKLYKNLYMYYAYYDALKHSDKQAKLSLISRPNKFVDNEIGFIEEVLRKFIVSFLPVEIEHLKNDGSTENMEFFNWIFTHFEDNIGYINLRYLITFFNKLFEIQYEQYEKNVRKDDIVKITNNNELKIFPIFSTSCIQKAYQEVQSIAIKNIRSLLEDDKQKNCFVHIHQIATLKRAVFNYGDIRFMDYDLKKEQYDKLLDILNVLGYLKQNGKRYSLPILYNYKLWQN